MIGLRQIGREKAPALLVGVTTALLAARAIGGVLAKLGHPGATLDDAFIHFQYARAIAEGHPLRYQAGEPISTGATSVVWPTLLAPFYTVGFRDLTIIWIAWLFSFIALGFLAWDAGAITRPLAGRTGAVIATALVLSFGGHVWCAASGMEVVPFAWIILRVVRRASEWAEGERDRRRLIELLLCANLAPLLRPEGFVFTALVVVTLALFGRPRPDDPLERPALRSRALGLAALVLPLGTIAILRAVSGSALTNTAVAKLLATNPYLSGPTLRQAIRANVSLLFRTLLDGEVWSAEFIPAGGALVGCMGLVAIAVLAVTRKRLWRGASILLLAAALLIPCLYTTFLWNRLRYLWPFASGWLIGLACLARVAGFVAGRYQRTTTPLVGGVLVGFFASKLPWVFEDISQSASGIDRQQVAAGRWASANLPTTARIGINDAGAIAYFGNRKTFDIVGLTTSGEARYWLAGAASRFEHYEKMPRDRLPTHFIVYPEWLGTDALLGPQLAQFTVEDATILGGRTKRAHVADWSLLGSGEVPWTKASGVIVDALDVADLESERDHEYSLEGAAEGEEVLEVAPAAGSDQKIADGGRGRRTHERFFARLAPHTAHRVIVRLAAEADTHVRIRSGAGAPVERPLGGGAWTELVVPIAADATAARTEIGLESDEPVTTFHYWLAVAPTTD